MRFRPWRLTAAVLAATLGVAQPSTAQYFGTNKVQYDSTPFRVLKTQHFDVYYASTERPQAAEAARMAERWYLRLSRLFDHDLRGRQPLILYSSPFAFQQTNVIEGQLGEGTGGVTESMRRRIVLPLTGSVAATDHVIGHELVHAFQFDVTSKAQSAAGGQLPGAQRLPLWFVEGMAEYLSRGPVDAETAMWLRDALAREALPPVDRLGDPKYFPYRWGHALWAYIAGRWGDATVVTALLQAGRSGQAEAALENVLGLKTEELSRDWHASIEKTYGSWVEAARAPGDVAQSPFERRDGREITVGPALSPDGRWVAFLSERELLSIDLYLADATTGEVETRIASTTHDAHLSSLQFIASAGAWDPSSRILAFASRRGPAATIERYDVTTKARLDPLEPPDVDDILTPAWSPDGRQLAFVGMHRGRYDLFVTTVATGETRALTNDAYAELHPLWAPDGRSIVVATDRFTTNLSREAAGPYQLARVLVADGAAARLTGPWDGDMLNPQWADPAGARLFFIGTRGGVPNVWRLDTASGAVAPATDITTGVAGITPTSPALSSAPAAGRLAFTAVDGNALRLFLQSSSDLPAVARSLAGDDAAILPPADRRTNEVATYLADATTGLPASAAGFDDMPYQSRFGLDAVVQPSVGVGLDRFGSFASGQIAFLWSDMLGDKSLLTAFQASTTLDSTFSYKDLGGAVSYADRSHRWNWMATAEQSPYRWGYVTGGATSVNGQTAAVTQEVISRQTLQAMSGVASYPFSQSRRVEFGAGVQRYSFTEHTRTIATVNGNDVLDEQTSRDFPGLTLQRSMAAMVYDRTSFGATGPVLGQRYRFEVSPTFGTIRYTGLLADYRRYVMPAPFYTIAARLMHYGRYGGGGSDNRLAPLFLGYPELVRGYDVGSFRAEECDAEGCPVFDRLFGSRMLVGNLELRMPLLRPFGLKSGMYGPLPVELALFADGGVAWDDGTSPAGFGGTRDWVSSAGVAARVNAFGFAVVQFSAARPFNRPGRGWVYQFSLTPGY
ncbi:MAG: hypothetical protein R2745_15545 [Vicinamibacterales bacterium]